MFARVSSNSEVVRLAEAAKLKGASRKTEARKSKAEGMSVTERRLCQLFDEMKLQTELARDWRVELRGASSS